MTKRARAGKHPVELPDLAEIRVVRRELGWTQRDLARAAGLSQSFINKIERNQADPGYKAGKLIFQVLHEAVAGSQRVNSELKAGDLMVGNVEFVASTQTVEEARKLMIKYDYSQLPVIDNGLVKGSITDRLLVALDPSSLQARAADVMGKRFPVVDPDTKAETLRHLLDEYAAVLVDKGDRQYGIVTKHDLLRAMK